jgi:hypothetical protein
LETGLIAVGAAATGGWRRHGTAEEWALETPVKRASKPNSKFNEALDYYLDIVFLCTVFASHQPFLV